MPDSAQPNGLGWIRVDHLAIAAQDPNQATAFWTKLFGLELDHWTISQSGGFRVSQHHFPQRQIGLEIIGPFQEDSFIQKFIDTRGAGMHHLTIEVEDADAACAWVRAELGIEPLSEPEEDFEWRQFFIHPRDTGGVLVQMYSWLPGRRPADWPK